MDSSQEENKIDYVKYTAIAAIVVVGLFIAYELYSKRSDVFSSERFQKLKQWRPQSLQSQSLRPPSCSLMGNKTYF